MEEKTKNCIYMYCSQFLISADGDMSGVVGGGAEWSARLVHNAARKVEYVARRERDVVSGRTEERHARQLVRVGQVDRGGRVE